MAWQDSSVVRWLSFLTPTRWLSQNICNSSPGDPVLSQAPSKHTVNRNTWGQNTRRNGIIPFISNSYMQYDITCIWQNFANYFYGYLVKIRYNYKELCQNIEKLILISLKVTTDYIIQIFSLEGISFLFCFGSSAVGDPAQGLGYGRSNLSLNYSSSPSQEKQKFQTLPAMCTMICP